MDRPVTVGALHVHETHSGVQLEACSVQESAPLVHKSGADHAVTVGQLQKLDHQRLDGLEGEMLARFPAVRMPVIHRFVPGMYLREIFMPAGTLLTSKIHKTEHPFVVLSGLARVYIPGEGVVELAGGHMGITQAGTRRVLYIVEDCRWITFHPLSSMEDKQRAAGATEECMLALIEERIIEPHRHLDGGDAHAEYLEALRALEISS